MRSRSSFSSPSAAPPPRASYPHHEKHRKTEIIHWFWCYESISFTKGYHCLCLCLFVLYLQEFVTLFKKNPVLPESNIEIRVFDGMIQIQIQLLLTEITVAFSFSFIPKEICYTVSKLRGYRCLFFSFYTYKNLLQCYKAQSLGHRKVCLTVLWLNNFFHITHFFADSSKDLILLSEYFYQSIWLFYQGQIK